ncbi:MAG: hypothetical protein ACRDID_10740, partial [Ktedonobacterales bacterium]
MKWFWQRRKKPPEASAAPIADRAPDHVTRVTAPRAGVRSTPQAGAEPRDALLAFARDLLNAQGARVRIEEDDLVVASLASGAIARYTTTIARARAEE